MRNLHQALRVERIKDLQRDNIDFGLVRLTYGKDDVAYSVHVRPHQWTGSGIQSTDVLALVGFSRAACPLFQGECYVGEVGADFPLDEFAVAFCSAKQSLGIAEGRLGHCGLDLPAPEGWGYFNGKPSRGRAERRSREAGDGHTASKLETLKQGEDEYFLFRMSFGYFANAKGWVFHYRPKNPPFTDEIWAAMQFLDAFHEFGQCLEFDFEPCVWRFMAYEEHEEQGFFGRGAEFAYRAFDSHLQHFSAGLKAVLDAHAALAPFGLSFLTARSPSVAGSYPVLRRAAVARGAAPLSTQTDSKIGLPTSFDVAVSFAGTERHLAQRLAEIVREAGFEVFYDSFYPEHLWGKDLVVLFDEIYGRKARYCVVFVSKEYVDHIWTNHERRSAQAKELELKGAEYILPILVDDSVLPGLPPTVGHVRLSERPIEEIAAMLIQKLRIS